MSTLTDRVDLAETLMGIALGGACSLDPCKALGLVLAVLDAVEEILDERVPGEHAGDVTRQVARVRAARVRVLAELSAAGGERR